MIQTLSLEWKAMAKKIGSGSGSPRRKERVSLPESGVNACRHGIAGVEWVDLGIGQGLFYSSCKV